MTRSSPQRGEAWQRAMADAYYAGIMHKPSVAKFDAKYRGYFLKMIRAKMHPLLWRLFAPEDLLQEFYISIFCRKNARSIADPLTQWMLLRRIAERVVLMANRRYLETAKRDLRRDRRQLTSAVA